MQNIFLFSIDLEDVRSRIPDGERYAERVPAMCEKYIRFLADHQIKTTFFTVGEAALAYPSLIKMISDEGHELACHTFSHIPLVNQDKNSFRSDLKRNMDALSKAGVNEIRGFRAPTFSMTEKTEWAYEVLAELGFTYSSSVLPAKNPLFGWAQFGEQIKKMNSGIWEIPMTLSGTGFLKIPFGGGVYFRVLPEFWIRKEFQTTFKRNDPVLGYFHPYDIDTEQEHFMHPEIDNNAFYNWLLFYNRKNVFRRLENCLKTCTVMPYNEYVKLFLK